MEPDALLKFQEQQRELMMTPTAIDHQRVLNPRNTTVT